MPITQQRMLNLIEEAERLVLAFGRLKRTITDQAAAMQRDVSITKDDALAVIKMHVANEPDPPHYATALERAHFDRFARKNDRDRQRVRQAKYTSAMLGEPTPRTVRTHAEAPPRPTPRHDDEWVVEDDDSRAAPTATATGLNALFDQGATPADTANAASALDLSDSGYSPDELRDYDTMSEIHRERTTQQDIDKAPRGGDANAPNPSNKS